MQVKKVLLFMGCIAILAVSGASVFGQARCSETACRIVQCNDYVWGFYPLPEPGWTVWTHVLGACVSECGDGPCARLGQFAIADVHGAGALVVDDVTHKDSAAIHAFRLKFAAKWRIDAKDGAELTLADWQKAIAKEFPQHKVHIMTVAEFNERAEHAVKSDCAGK